MRKLDLVRRARDAVKTFGFKQWFLLSLNLALVLGSAACFLGLGRVSGALAALHAADWFRGGSETRFAQLACYLPVDQGKSEEDILAFRQSLDARMVEQALEAPEGGSLYIDAYSGTASVTAASESTRGSSVKATGVGGDFFYFHPYLLRGGSYIRSGDLMDDLVVLDEEMAWKLFGGVDLAGMTMTINGQPFVVAGVIARETDFASQRAYTGGGGVFMSFSALQRLVEDASITSYEIVMPDPISNYAMGLVQDVFPIGDGDVVENSSRYSLGHLLEVIRSFGFRSMRTNGVDYPYWENAARLTEDYAALLLVLGVLLALCPVLFLLTIAFREIRRVYRLAKAKIPEKVEAGLERRKEERLERQFKKKSGGE